MSKATATVMTFDELCAHQLKIDHYQRPYVWGAEKVGQLLADLARFREQGEPSYYLGTVLLHRDKDAYFVVDGQQRLSSLAILHHALTGELPGQLNFRYRSPVSAQNLLLAREVIANAERLPADIFDQLRFTVIVVDDEDLAFTFFDTQNNRGVTLNATDLLKAYHLRAITGEEEQASDLQRHCARRWEAVQVSGPQNGSEQRDFAPELFRQYLWRARNWRGQRRLQRESHDALLDAFQKGSVRVEQSDSLPLYPVFGNQFANRLRLKGGDERQLDRASEPPVGDRASSLPFSLRQPVHRGLGFFLYAEKYAALLNELLYLPVADGQAEVAGLRVLYESVVSRNSQYLRELFRLALLTYVDRFSCQQMLEFAQRMELVLGGLRLEKQSIYKETVLKYLRDAEHNVLDVISGAYRPDEVMDFLRAELADAPGYGPKPVKAAEEDKGVRGRYIASLRAYHQRSASLPSDLPLWLQSIFNKS